MSAVKYVEQRVSIQLCIRCQYNCGIHIVHVSPTLIKNKTLFIYIYIDWLTLKGKLKCDHDVIIIRPSNKSHLASSVSVTHPGRSWLLVRIRNAWRAGFMYVIYICYLLWNDF